MLDTQEVDQSGAGAGMVLGGKAKRVRIYVNEGDHIGHKSAALAIVEFLRKENASGATVLRAVEGFGGTGVVHTTSLGDFVQKLPVVIEWVDSADRVERLLTPLKEMIVHGMITVDDTEVVLYAIRPVQRVSNHLTAADVMSRDVAAVAEDAPIRSVVELMLGKIYRAVPVVRDGRPVGIITNSDLVTRGGLEARIELLPSLDAAERGVHLQQLAAAGKTAGAVMTPSPVTVAGSARLPEVVGLMAQRRLKRLPVVDASGRLTGMISRLDLLRTVARNVSGEEGSLREGGLNADLTMAQVMRREVPTVHPETPVAEVLQAVSSTRLNRAVVVDHDRHVVGLVTDAELLERIAPTLRPGALRSLVHRLPFAHPGAAEAAAEQRGRAHTAQDLMLTQVQIAPETAPLRDALTLMLQGKEKLIAVVDGTNRLVGVVDRADILHGLVAPS